MRDQKDVNGGLQSMIVLATSAALIWSDSFQFAGVLFVALELGIVLFRVALRVMKRGARRSAAAAHGAGQPSVLA
jgi:hypothetical protein